MSRRMAVLAAAFIGFGGMVALQAPSQAAGDTARTLGCAAHWRTTAGWNECVNSPGATVRLQVECDWQIDYSGPWHYIQGSADPIDEFECDFRAVSAWNGYK